jgi:hypothetical protein
VIGNVNEDLLANKDGTIFDPQATKIEQYVQSQLATALLTKKAPTNRPDASAVSANIDRTENILATGDYSITIGITPKGYAHSINVTIGFTNPALA